MGNGRTISGFMLEGMLEETPKWNVKAPGSALWPPTRMSDAEVGTDGVGGVSPTSFDDSGLKKEHELSLRDVMSANGSGLMPRPKPGEA